MRIAITVSGFRERMEETFKKLESQYLYVEEIESLISVMFGIFINSDELVGDFVETASLELINILPSENDKEWMLLLYKLSRVAEFMKMEIDHCSYSMASDTLTIRGNV